MLIAIILGTRPEIIKLSPIIRACVRNHIPYFILHTGQHYSYELDKIFFEQLSLPQPKYNLHVGSGPQGEQTGKMLAGIEQILVKEQPDRVITLGDPNSAFAGTLSAAKLHIPVCHIEAGRRSFDRTMPEELNRLMIDQIADCLYTPNEYTKQNLLNAGIAAERITVSGDPITDAVAENKLLAEKESSILERLSLTPHHYFLATIHRPDNTGNKQRLTSIITAFRVLSSKHPVVLSAHPKTKIMIEQHGISTEGIILTEPLGYLDFLCLEMHALAVLTDSGSLQEEACILKTPCITLRDDTERQETIAIGANILTGVDMPDILKAVDTMLASDRHWENPFGKEGVAEQIVLGIVAERGRWTR